MDAGHLESLLRSFQQWSSDYDTESDPGDYAEDTGRFSSPSQPPSDRSSSNNNGSRGDELYRYLELMQDFMPEEIPTNLRSVFTVFYVVIMLLAVAGNAATILVIGVNREMRTVTNIFLLSLAVSDALIALVNMPVQLAFYLQNEWTMGEALCKFSPYLQGVVIVTSILTLTTLAIDRYYAICHPLRARHVHTITRAVVLASAIWAVALLLVLPQLFIQRIEPKLVFETDDVTGATSLRTATVCVEYFESRRAAAAYTCLFYVVLYVFPVATMFSTYGTIAAKLWRRRPIGDGAAVAAADPSRREWTRRLREKRRVVRMLVVVVVVFAVSWFPFFTLQVYLLTDAAQRRLATTNSFRAAMAFCQLLGYSNSCVNPIVYCFMNDSFQKNFLKTLRCRWAAAAAAWRGDETGAGVTHPRRRSSCTDADKVNGVTTTRHTALDHTTTV